MNILNKYAQLLTQYSLSLQKGERLLIRTTTLAEPLVREIYREALKMGAFPYVQFEFDGQDRITLLEASDEFLSQADPLREMAFKDFEAFLYIKAPYNLRETAGISRQITSSEAQKAMAKTYNERTATRSLKRSLCLYPTHASAQEAGMSLEEYEQFVFNACNLYAENPKDKWLEMRAFQQGIVDFLNTKKTVRYKASNIDITFSTEGRTWINSDGQTNMPSGEVYTSPVEDSVNGHIHFTYPVIFQGEEVEGITLWVENGEVQKWDALRGKHVLDDVFKLPGARRFGEAAIGNNTNIQRFTKNILFDEKIGGTVHMAIGQSYLITGGKNESPIHWDMIADMTQDGEIYADGQKIYEKGRFLSFE